MEQLYSLLKVLSTEQKNVLKDRCAVANSAAEKLIYLLLTTTADTTQLKKQLKISVTTFAKVQTQAKDTIAVFFKDQCKSPLADIQLVQKLLMNGETTTALKFYNQFEKIYEERQNWQMLDFLYHEGFRLAQINGDIKFLNRITKQRSYYAVKYADYVTLYGEVMTEMVRGEKFEERRQNIPLYLKKAKALNKRAYEGGHHALIHNTLLIIYHIYSRYYNSPNQTWAVVQQIITNHKKYQHIMNPVTDAVIRLNIINFLSTHEGYGVPEPYIEETLKRIDIAGTLAKTNLVYALVGYYLCQHNTKQVTTYLALLSQTEDRSHFAAFKYAALAILCFIQNDFNGFTDNIELFYKDPQHINLPDSELIIRIFELLAIKHTSNNDTGLKKLTSNRYYKSKADALRVYFNRNLNKTRYAEEYSLLSFLTTPSAKNRARITGLLQSKYRNNRMLAAYALKFIP